MHDRIEVAPRVFRRVQQSRAAYSGDSKTLAPLYVAREQKDLTVGKLRVYTGLTMHKLPMLAIGHDWRLATCEAASRQELQGRDADRAAAVSALNGEFNPARVDPVLRVLVGVHVDICLSVLVAADSCEMAERPIHQKACSTGPQRRRPLQSPPLKHVHSSDEGRNLAFLAQPERGGMDVAPVAPVHRHSLFLSADRSASKNCQSLQADNTHAFTPATGERELDPGGQIAVRRAQVHTFILHRSWVSQFDLMPPMQATLVQKYCAETAGAKGGSGRSPNPVRLLETAQTVYETERQECGP